MYIGVVTEEWTIEIELDAAGGPDRLSVRHVPIPQPGPGQVLVQVEAAGVAFNDVMTRQGRNPGPLPRVLGFDVVGKVMTVGGGVTDLPEGQRVAALIGTGGYASHVILDAGSAIPVRPDVDAAQVDALVLNYVTAWQMLHRTAQVRPGQSALIIGAAGGVGSALVELARTAGVNVFGTSSPARRESVVAAGAHWVQSAGDLPGKVDVVFDPVGGPSLRTSRQVTVAGGVVVSYGFSFAAAAGHSKHGGLARTAAALALARLAPGPRVRLYLVEKAAQRDPAAYREDLNRLVDMLADGEIRPLVTTLPLVQAAEGHRRLEAREVVGKLVLTSTATT